MNKISYRVYREFILFAGLFSFITSLTFMQALHPDTLHQWGRILWIIHILVMTLSMYHYRTMLKDQVEGKTQKHSILRFCIAISCLALALLRILFPVEGRFPSWLDCIVNIIFIVVGILILFASGLFRVHEKQA